MAGKEELHLDKIVEGVEILLPWEPAEPRVMKFVGESMARVSDPDEREERAVVGREANLFFSNDCTQVAFIAFI